MGLKQGDLIPLFTLPDQDGNLFSIQEHIGRQALLIYFYPKDDSPGCTREACSIRDNFAKFSELNCRVIGISADDAVSHKSFINNYNLPFTLLSDNDGKIRKLFGVKPAIPGILAGRKTFLVDLDGRISHIFEYQYRPKKHVFEALKALSHD